jgi:precorrin-4 methylase
MARSGGGIPPAGKAEGDEQAALALFMSAREPEELRAELERAGFASDTPCAIVHRVSWPDEEVVRCRLEEVPRRLGERDWSHLTLLLVGDWLAEPAAGA